MKNILVALLLLAGFSLNAQNSYKFADIPDSLKKGADYVVWESKKVFEIKNKGEANEKVKFAVCIINKTATDYNRIFVYYNKKEEIKKFKAWIYNAHGELVKKAKKTDFEDMSAVSGSTLFADERIIMAEMLNNDYPYTLVYEYEKTVDGLMNYPIWTFQEPKTGVINSEIKVITKKNHKFNSREFNFSGKKEVNNIDDKTIYRWYEENLTPFEPISLAARARDYHPMLYLAPVKFNQGGYDGDMENWKEYGYWRWHLFKDRHVLSEDIVNKITSLVKDAKSIREKIKILYQHMQNNTRYVSVQEGIGGWQPFPAEYVYKNGYGDCKALSFYMLSMLKAINIKSHYAIIRAGRNAPDFDTSFVSNQSNHAILCVPQPNDTIWLECTSQQQPFNFLGSFTNDRHALLITENGGKLVKTPKYGKEVSTQNRTVNLKINAEGDAKVTVRTEFKGLQYENRKGWSSATVKEQKDDIKEAYGISGMEINSFKFSELKEEIPYIIEDLDLDILRLASTSGKRMFIKLNLFNNTSYVPKNEERTIPFRLTYEFADNDTLSMELPEGYEIENQPKDRNYQTKFGSYTTSFKQDGNRVLFIRSYSSEKGIFPAEDYKAYYDFRRKIKKADKAKLVLVKKV